jgi:RNA polymerase sigma-70 factor (ECF subfamily)
MCHNSAASVNLGHMASQSGKPSDAELVLATARRDERAFAVLYRRYLPLVVRWCVVHTGERELAADLAAETFAAALIAARRYRPERGEVDAWLLGIARNKLRESRRRGRIEASARKRLSMEPVAITDADLERVDELGSREEEIVPLLRSLPTAQREALLGRVVGERSYRELAGELRCSEMVVRQRVSRGLQALRSRLEERM